MPPIVRSALPEDEPEIVGLWRSCDLVASYNDPGADFRFGRAGAKRGARIGWLVGAGVLDVVGECFLANPDDHLAFQAESGPRLSS